ncbi:DUF4355 domain-containing protein [Diplocloster modestus]|uniref:DUF4355 domain-containing protein n=1 Tax=Diplocloster modestus TaxID=2850322 RepID=A0ABS6KBZ9_9FIRM|nr:DUF4355 domain-containing protein [Diplocloster modestus]MBU9728045.1 DUF4355 domain-containing protein [Diplocloster modestus]
MKNKTYLALQLFAEPASPAGPEPGAKQEPAKADPSPADPQKTDPKQPDPKYTDDDVDKILNKKFAEWQEKKQKELDEAKLLAGMGAQEKAERERDLMKQQLEKLMKQQSLSEMSKTARSILAEKSININDDLLSMLVSEDAEKTKGTIDSFVTLFQDAVKKAVAEELKGNVPKAGTNSGYTKEQILAIKDRVERQKLIRENMNLFK